MNPWSEALWLNEHGPRGGDEINIPQAGKNYGWPLATHGINYSGLPIPEAKAKRFRGPNLPVCLAGLSRGERDGLYSAPTFPQWQHKLFIGALKETSLIVLAVDGNQVREEEITGGARKTHPRCSRGTRRLSVRFNRRV